MNENLRIDENTRWALGAITNDSNEQIRNLRVNPVTGRLIVEAVVTSTNTSIGSTIPGATHGSVFFAGPGGTLDQDNPNLFYDEINAFLGIGTNTPTATLQVDGTIQFNLGSDASGDMYYRDSSGFLQRIPLGSTGQILTVSSLGYPTWSSSPIGYNLIQDNGTSLTQRTTLNFVDYFTVSDASSKTNVSINTTELGADANLGTSLSSNTNLITGLATNSTFLSTLDLSQIGGQIDLSTQVTGLLNATNIDTTSLFGLVGVEVDGVTITGDGTTGNPLVATAGAGGNGIALEATVTQTAHGFVVGDVIKVSGTNTFAKAQGNNEINSEAVGIVTTVVSANSFKYISSAIQLAIAPVGTPGSAVWLDPSVAGGMTTTKPSTIGQVARALGTIIESGAKMYFDIAALAEVIGTGSGGSTNFFSTSTPSYGLISPDTGSTAVLELSDGTLFSYPVGTYNNYCITADKTKVYKATITYTIGSNYTISLEEYIGNANGSIGTLAVTYTGTGAHTVGTNNFEGGIFVDGNKVFIPLANGTFLNFFTEWTLSGTSLTSPLTTNLNYSTLTNFVNFYWFYDGTYYYTYNNAANDLITKWTYSAGTFTSVATASLSTSIDTQTSYGTAIGIDPRMKLLFFRIVTGKIGNFGMLVTTGSTFSAPKFVSGVIYLENSSI